MRRPHCSTIQHPTWTLITACLQSRGAPNQYYHPYQRFCKCYRICSRLAMSCGFRTSDPDQLFFQICYLCMSRSVVTHSFPTLLFSPYFSLLSPCHCYVYSFLNSLRASYQGLWSPQIGSKYSHSLRRLFNTLREAKGFHELVITNVPPGWEDFLWEVEEDLPSIRKTYNPESRCLRLKIRPTYAHNYIAE